MGLSVKSIRIIVAYNMSLLRRFEFETEEVDRTTERL